MQPFVVFLFFLSGISGLTLEVVWVRHLEHVFGSTTLSVSTVLTCFMGGLALGSFLFGKVADKVRRPLLAYGLLEGVVGLFALLIPSIIRGVYPELNRALTASLSNDFLLMSLARFGLVAAVLVVPTTCMGATLPMLSRHIVSTEGHLRRVGARVGTLYTVNTIGAVVGVLLTTFVLLACFGLKVANATAGAINLSLCAAVLAHSFGAKAKVTEWLARRASRRRAALFGDEPWESSTPPLGDRETAEEMEDAVLRGETEDFRATSVERRVAIAAFFVSGLAAMSLQVVWNRAMALVIGSSVYSFALVLIAFLVGLAAGAAVFARRSRRIADPVVTLGLAELGVAGCAMLNFLYTDDLPRVFARLLLTLVPNYYDHENAVMVIMFTVAALAVLPSTFFMGATFPLTIRTASTSLGRVGRDVGSVYAVNTLGAICGSFLSAFVFVPAFSRWFQGAGMQATFFLSTALYAALGLTLLAVSRARALGRIAACLGTAAVTASFLLFAPRWDLTAMTIGLFRFSHVKAALDEESWGTPDLKYYFDGVTTTVSIELWGRHIALKNNGKVDASNGDDMPTQIMVAAYPLLLHSKGPKDLDVAIVGFGSGVTVGAALELPVRHVDVIELESAVVEASSAFGSTEGEAVDPELDVNHLVYRRRFDPRSGARNPSYDPSDPETFVINDRLTVYANDGRNYLASTPKRYDVIISEPSNPWITGVSNMFTRDNFAEASAALSPSGVYCQWVQLYEMSPENIKTIFRTFSDAFPFVAVFAAEDLSSDAIMLGSFEPLSLDLSHVARAMEDAKTRAELERAYIYGQSDVLARVLLVDKSEVDAFTSMPNGDRGPINTDDNALIEFAAPRDLITHRRFSGYLGTIYTPKWPYAKLNKVIKGLGSGKARIASLVGQAISLLGNGRKGESEAFLEEAKMLAPDDPGVVEASRLSSLLRGTARVTPPDIASFEPQPTGSAERDAQIGDLLKDVGKLVRGRAYPAALQRYTKLPETVRTSAASSLRHLEGYLRFLNADPDDTETCEDSIEILTALIREDGDYAAQHPELHYYLGLCHDYALHFDKAVKHMRTYVAAETILREQQRIADTQQRANLEAALAGRTGTAPIALPADLRGAPTIDSPGESPKTFWDGSEAATPPQDAPL